MAQFLRPDADTSEINGWTTTPLWSKIDEVTPSDSDFITRVRIGTGSFSCKVTLSDATDPLSSTGHVIRYRARKVITTGDVTLTVQLRETTTIIASLAPTLTSSFADYSLTLNATQANNIGDYGNLDLRFFATFSGAAEKSVEVSWAEFEVPNPAPVNKSVSDSMSFADARAITAQVPITPGGLSLSDAAPVVQGSVPISDALSATDARDIQGQVSIADVLNLFMFSPQDPARVAEARVGRFTLGQHAFPSIVQAQVPIADSSLTGAEALAIQANIAIADALTGTSALIISADVPIAEALALTDTITITAQMSLADAMSGTETVQVTAQITLADALAGLEALIVQANITESDAITGAIALAIEAQITQADAWTGSEVIDANFAIQEVFITDFMTFFERNSDRARVAEARIGRFFLGVDKPFDVQAQVPVSDTMTGADARTIQAQVTLSDAMSGAEALAITVQVPLSDSMTGAELIGIIKDITLSDSMAFYDTKAPRDSILGLFRLAETRLGINVAAIQITVQVPVSDSFVGAEAIALTKEIFVSDSMAGGEVILREIHVLVSDSLTGTTSNIVVNIIILPDVPGKAFRRGFMVLFDEDVE